MLKIEEFVPYAPVTAGTVRINHSSSTCRGDSNSLKIERKENGAVYAHCFRCGDSGRDFSRCRYHTLPTHKENKLSGTDYETYGKGDYSSCSYDPGEWPLAAYRWLMSAGISLAEIEKYQICFRSNRVILPVFWREEKVGYQSRRIYDDDSPKYITRVQKMLPFLSFGGDQSGIVIVEDILSAIKVSRVQKAIAVLSTNLSAEGFEYIISNYDRYWVWFDMDNPEVIRKSIKLLNKLKLFGNTKLITTPKDPKYYNETEIKEILYGT